MSEPIPLSGLTEALSAHADVAAMTDVLTSSLAALLPADMVTVERRRTVGDRLAGRPGTPVGLTVRTTDRRLVLRADAGGHAVATSEHVVHGVRLSGTPIALEQWIALLAAELRRRAEADERARDVLHRFLLG